MLDFAKIKMGTCPRVGQIGEPLAEQVKMGWVIMSSGREGNNVTALFTKYMSMIMRNCVILMSCD